MRKRTIIVLIISAVVITVVITFVSLIGDEKSDFYTVKRGNILSTINCVGEVQGGNATSINIPDELRDWSLRVYGYKIIDVIQEGKLVQKGEYVMKLDDSSLSNNLKNKMKDQVRVNADLKNAVLDSTVNLTNFREQITNLKMDLEYQKIDLEQSKYESEAEQRRTKMKYQKAEIALNKKKRDYVMEQNKLKVRIARFQERANRLLAEIQKIQKAIQATRIVSTGNGIFMLEKDYSGKKYTKGTEVHVYNNRPIAILPDMSTIVSDAYVKEIDVTKVHLNDHVDISIDALPDKEFTGKLVKIANMGEDHKNFDMKAFKVKIQFDVSDSELKPGMTTNNSIVISNVEDCLLVPQDAVFSESDEKYVFLKRHGEALKTRIKAGAEDDKNIEVLEGLSEGDKILLNLTEEEVEMASL